MLLHPRKGQCVALIRPHQTQQYVLSWYLIKLWGAWRLNHKFSFHTWLLLISSFISIELFFLLIPENQPSVPYQSTELFKPANHILLVKWAFHPLDTTKPPRAPVCLLFECSSWVAGPGMWCLSGSILVTNKLLFISQSHLYSSFRAVTGTTFCHIS